MTTQQAIIQRIDTLNPVHYTLDNQSDQHAGYYVGKESHFRLVIVSDQFKGKRPLLRHQMIYALINPLLTRHGGTIHALSIHAYTPDEWQITNVVPVSPACQKTTPSL